MKEYKTMWLVSNSRMMGKTAQTVLDILTKAFASECSKIKIEVSCCEVEDLKIEIMRLKEKLASKDLMDRMDQIWRPL